MSFADACPVEKNLFRIGAFACVPQTRHDVLLHTYKVLHLIMRTETLSIRISKAERTALRVAAQKEKLSQGQLVRKALQAYGVKPVGKNNPRAHDLVKDLIGKYDDGPGDLATNPKYMEGFGQ